MSFAVFAEGLSKLSDLGPELSEKNLLSAVQAINKAAEVGRKMAADEIRRQVAFPAQYLAPSGGRLTVARKATKASLEAAIRARSRPTSLARFVVGTPGPTGASVQVKPGHAVTLKRAFLVKLRAGSGDIETKFNKGLAVRLRPGDSLRNKYASIRMQKGLYLLYGPSVDQVFLDNAGKGVAVDISPDVLDKMEDEFLRLLER